MPLSGHRLIIEPKFPRAEGLMKIGAADAEDGNAGGPTAVNGFWSRHFRRYVWIYKDRDGRVRFVQIPGVGHLDQAIMTIGCSDAWGIEQESNALEMLGSLIKPHALKQYLLTGMFLERSTRSGVMYLFRRLRPTVAIRFEGDESRILCAMCMHPIGYYKRTWGGAMCPTDDVIAHLMMMRGDEKMFWRRCNQHPPWVPEAGL